MVRAANQPRLPRRLDPRSVDDLTERDEVEAGDLSGELIGATADHVGVSESRVADVRFTGSQLRGLRLRDVVLERCDLSGAIMEEARMERCAFVDCRLSGSVLADSRLRHVTFEACRLDASSFRMTSLEIVRFDRCDLSGADFYEARMPGGQMLGCQLRGTDFSKATLPGTELHGSHLDEIVGVLALRDVVIDPLQVTALAHAFLNAHGIGVSDEPTLL